jgi:hypothetical protein
MLGRAGSSIVRVAARWQGGSSIRDRCCALGRRPIGSWSAAGAPLARRKLHHSGTALTDSTGTVGGLSDFDVATLRGDTPSCQDFIHLNAAGASPPPDVVVDTQVDHLRCEAAIGGYAAAATEKTLVAHAAVYTSIAKLLNGAPREIALMDSSTYVHAHVCEWRAHWVALEVPVSVLARICITNTTHSCIADSLAH